MQLVRFLRKSAIKGTLGMLLITVFAIKCCDLFIDCYVAYNKSISVKNIADNNDDNPNDENRDVNEDCFEKSEKKLYSCFDNAISFKSLTWVTPLSVHWYVYSFSIFTEPLRVVLTPPPNPALV